MHKKIQLLNKQKKTAEKWIEKHGAANFDFKNENIILFDGGIFYIEPVKYKAHKIIGKKKLPNGFTEIKFSKKPSVNRVRYDGFIWIKELDETIKYFQSMKRMLNKIGFKTGYC